MHRFVGGKLQSLVVSLYLVCLVRTSFFFLGCVCLTVRSVEASSSVVIVVVVVVQASPSRAWIGGIVCNDLVTVIRELRSFL